LPASWPWRAASTLAESHQAIEQLRGVAGRLAQRAAQLPAGDRDLATAVAALHRRLDELTGRERDFADAPEPEPSLTAVHGGLAALAVSVGTGDAAPTAQAAAAFAAYRAQLDRVLAASASASASDLPALNRRLAASGLGTIEPPP